MVMGVEGAGAEEGAKVGREGASQGGGGSLGQGRDQRRKNREREIDQGRENRDQEKGDPSPGQEGGDQRTKGRSRERENLRRERKREETAVAVRWRARLLMEAKISLMMMNLQNDSMIS